jgi:hypothetical protein
MANLPLIENYRAQIDQAPAAATPRPGMAGPINPVGLQEAANYQGTLAQTLDRLSSQMFKIGAEYATESGLQYVAENRLTAEQLQAIARGDVSKNVPQGPSISIFDNAVRKARALEVAGHAEMEARQQIIRMLPAIEQGALDADAAKNQINALLDGYGKALVQIDPEASLKFRATIAALGNTVYEKAATAEIKRNKEIATLRLELDYEAFLPEITQDFLRETPPIDSSTGLAIPADAVVQAKREAFLARALLIGGPDAANKFNTRMLADITKAKVDAVTAYVTSPDGMADAYRTRLRLQQGDAGKLSEVYQSLPQESKNTVLANFATASAQLRTLINEKEAQEKNDRNLAANDLLLEYHGPQTSPTRKQQIGVELTRLQVLSIEQIEKFLDPKAKAGDPYVFADIETRVALGEITDSDELKRIAARAGMNGQQYAQLNQPLLRRISQEETEAKRYLRRVAGTPDVVSTFTTKDDQHKLDKERRLGEIWKASVDVFRQANPGTPIPYVALARQAETDYNNNEKQDANKAKARRELDNYVRDELVKKKKVPEGFVIDENTSIDDLVARGIIPKNDRNNTADFVRRRQEILRRISQ